MSVVCSGCGRGFPDPKRLRRHHDRLKCAKNYECSNCHTRFATYEERNAHEKQASHNHICKKCGKGFELSKEYITHKSGPEPCKMKNVWDYQLREEVKKLRRSAQRQNKKLRREVTALTEAVTKLAEQLATSRE